VFEAIDFHIDDHVLRIESGKDGVRTMTIFPHGKTDKEGVVLDVPAVRKILDIVENNQFKDPNTD